MFKRLNLTRFLSVAAAIVAFCILSSDTYGQCGLYFKRAKTWSFPVSRIHLNGVADMTGDGFQDLVVADNGFFGPNQRARFFVLPNLGDGSFGSPWATIEPPGAGIIFNSEYSLGDVNGDTRPDLMVMLGSTASPTSFMTFINNGNGTFTNGPEVVFGPGNNHVLADVNGDGKIDRLFLNSGDYKFMASNGDGSFAAPVTLFSGHGAPRWGDFNGDGRLDFVDTSHLHLNNGDSTWGAIDISSLFNGQVFAGFGDFNGDGKLDFLTVAGPGGLTFGILLSTGTGFNRTDRIMSSDPSWVGFPRVANWNGNSAPDIVFQPINLHKKIVMTNDGSGNFTESVENGRIDILSGQQFAYADFDNDGKLDRLQASSNVSSSWTIMLKDVTSFTFTKQVCTQPGQARIVDYDYNNVSDISYWDPATGAWARRTRAFAAGPPPSTETIFWGLGSFGDIPAPGDFDGDGVTDRSVFRDSTGYWWILKSSDGAWLGIPFGTTGDKPVAADYDGDSITDIAVYRPSDGVWHIWYMGTQQYAGFRFGASEDKPVQADYDGDFKTDIAVFRPSNGVWYVLRSSDFGYMSVLWGFGTDRPIPGDFDGDGKADIAVWRESPDRIAYILRSTNLSMSAYQWGMVGDIPQIMDHDGDFVDDIAVYRPSTTQWFITTNGFGPSGTFGVSGAIPIASILKVD